VCSRRQADFGTLAYRAGPHSTRILRIVRPVDDPCRQWKRELAFLKSKAVKAGLEKSATTPLSGVLRDAIAACDAMLRDLETTHAEHARLSKSLSEADSEWGALFERLPCPCVCTDVTGLILKANAAAASLLAVTSRHLDTRLLTHFAEDREQFSRALRRAVWDRVEVHERMSIRPRDRAPVQVNAVVMAKSPDDNNTILWFLQPAGEAAANARNVRRGTAPILDAAGSANANA
jgi:PAS domain-containing protein